MEVEPQRAAAAAPRDVDDVGVSEAPQRAAAAAPRDVDDVGVSEAPRTQRLDLEHYRVQGVSERAYYIREFISESEEQLLMSRARGAPRAAWTALRGRRVLQWGRMPGLPPMPQQQLPHWLHSLSVRVSSATRLPQPDHVLVNEYAPGQGILPHEDGPRFLPNVLTISTGSSTVLRLWRHGAAGDAVEAHTLLAAGGMLLERRSLLVLGGSLYTDYKHSIEPLDCDPVQPDLHNLTLCAPPVAAATHGTLLPRETRLSFTLRKVATRQRDVI